MMIDFHTRTCSFSNCGSRRVPDACCWRAPTATPAANTTVNTAPSITFRFIGSSVAATRPPEDQPLPHLPAGRPSPGNPRTASGVNQADARQPPGADEASRRKSQQARGVSTQDVPPVVVANVDPPQRVEHLLDAADLVGVVAAGQDVVGAREPDRELDGIGVEVQRVVIEPPEILGWRLRDVPAALRERYVASIVA